jgi:hypothetical protein
MTYQWQNIARTKVTGMLCQIPRHFLLAEVTPSYFTDLTIIQSDWRCRFNLLSYIRISVHLVFGLHSSNAIQWREPILRYGFIFLNLGMLLCPLIYLRNSKLCCRERDSKTEERELVARHRSIELIGHCPLKILKEKKRFSFRYSFQIIIVNKKEAIIDHG